MSGRKSVESCLFLSDVNRSDMFLAAAVVFAAAATSASLERAKASGGPEPASKRLQIDEITSSTVCKGSVVLRRIQE